MKAQDETPDLHKGNTATCLEHGLEDHGVALDDLAQGDELGVGAQEIQRSTPCRATRARGRLHSEQCLGSQALSHHRSGHVTTQ